VLLSNCAAAMSKINAAVLVKFEFSEHVLFVTYLFIGDESMTHSDIHKSLVHKEYLYSAKNQQSLDAELSNGLFHLLTQSFAETKRLNFGLSQELRLTSHLRTSSLTSSVSHHHLFSFQLAKK